LMALGDFDQCREGLVFGSRGEAEEGAGGKRKVSRSFTIGGTSYEKEAPCIFRRRKITLHWIKKKGKAGKSRLERERMYLSCIPITC